MGRPAYALSPAALARAAELFEKGEGYRQIASQLFRRRLIRHPVDGATVRRRLFDAGVADRQRRPARRTSK